jgi:tetratricopeptide (TPR) repeat protein
LENLATITTITGHSFPSTNYNNVARVMREETEADLQEEATPESKRSTYSNADRVPTPPVPALSGDQVEIDVPDDGNCLFWAAAIGLLLPTLQDRTAFNVMYERLFGASGTVVLKSEKKEAKSKIIEINSESTREGVYHILISYDCQKDTPQQFQGQILEKLICEVFRGRVVDKMNEFDLGRQQAIYSDAGRSNWKNYTDHMRLAGSWGGDAEIQAISQLAQRNIAVSDGSTTNRYDFAGATQSLSLIHTNAAGAKGGVKNHYHFHLDKTAYTQHMQNLSGRPNVLAPLSLHVKIETQGKAAYQEGLKFTQKEEYKRAVFQYEEAVKCVPENIEYREALADTQYKLRDFASALENYIAILKYAPEKNIPALLYKLGDTLSHLDRLEEAITKYEEALAINPLDQMGVSKVGLLRAKLSQQAKPSLDDKKQPADEKLDYKKLSSLSDRLYRYIEKSDIADLQGLLLNIKSPQQREALLQGRAKPAESLASPANEAALIALQMPSDAERSKAIAVVKFLVRNGALLDVSLKEQIQKMAIENGFKIGDFSLESKSRFSQYLSRPFAPGVVSRAGYFSQSGAADNTAPLADSSQAVINDKPESLIEINLDDDWGDPNANDAAFN